MAKWLFAVVTLWIGAPLAVSGDPFGFALVATAFLCILFVSFRASPARQVRLGEIAGSDWREILVSSERQGHPAGGEDNPIILTVIRR